MHLEHILDTKVNATLDTELRVLLSSCFTGEVNEVFRHQRFFSEMPAHRWLVRDEKGRLIAHLAVHDKLIGTSTGDLRIGGIAEVCVATTHRGQGLVRQLLIEAHQWMIGQDIPFGALFGDIRVYRSSGYGPVDNPIRHLIPKTGDWRIEPMTSFLIKPVATIQWPTGMIDLRGPKF